MSMSFEDLVQMIEEIAPLELQEPWDNSGVQIVVSDKTICRVLTCLEITDQIIAEAESKVVDVIITHHPLIFSPLKSIDYRTPTGAVLEKLAALRISVYSCHTPFDKIIGGNNDYIADMIGLKDTGALSFDGQLEMIGRVGQFADQLTLAEAIEVIKKKLGIEYIHTVGAMETKVKTVAVCTGSGSDLLDTVANNGCQLFITGDVKYHDAQKARALGLCLIDAGHYGTERFFGENFSTHLINKVGNKIEILNSQVNIDPFDFEAY